MENFITDFFTNKDNTLDITKVIFTLLGVVVTAGISLIVALINNSRSKKTLFINTITNNRIEWMNNTKEMINHFIVLTEVNTHSPVKISGDSRFEYFNELSKTRNKILLHLNFKGYIDKKIIETINEIEYSIQVLADFLELYKSTEEKKLEFAFKLYKNELIKINPTLFLENILDFDINSTDKFRSKIQELGGIEELYNSISDVIHEDMLKHIKELNNVLKTEPKKINEIINKLHNDLLAFTQVYMKVEWDRVKKESIGKFKEKENKKFKKKIDSLIDQTNRSTFNYSLNKLENHYRNILEENKK